MLFSFFITTIITKIYIMKKNYTKLCLILMLLLANFSFGQVRIIEVTPSTNSIKIKNLGSTDEDISSYWICSRIRYDQISDLTIVNGDYNLSPNEEVEFTSDITLNEVSADLGLYSISSFGSSTAMIDFLQWGAGGIGRESVAVSKGIWAAGDFIDTTTTYEFTGSSTDTGSSFWQSSVLSINAEQNLDFDVYPNPASNNIVIQLPLGEDKIGVTLYDFSGRIVKEAQITTLNNSINIENFISGVYILKVTTSDKLGVKRIIKK